MNFCKNFGLKEMAVALGFLNLIPSAQGMENPPVEGMKFNPLCMEDLRTMNANAIINVDNDPILSRIGPGRVEDCPVFRDCFARFGHALENQRIRGFGFMQAYYAATFLGDKHIIAESCPKGILSINSDTRPTVPGGFCAITGDWRNRWRLVCALFDEARQDPDMKAKDDGNGIITVNFTSRYNLFKIELLKDAGPRTGNSTLTVYRNVQELVIGYQYNARNQRIIKTCYPN